MHIAEGYFKSRQSRVWLAFLLYNFLTAVLLRFHEAGRDEWQAIQIGANIHSLVDFLHRLRAEGHPFLWFVLCKTAWGIYPSYNSIVVLHWLICLTSSWLVLSRIRGPFVYKVLFLFGYFMLYEYAAIVRNYGLTVMFALLAVNELQREERCNYLILFFGLAGLAFSHIYGLMMACGLIFYLYFPLITQPQGLFSNKRLNGLSGGFIVVALLTLHCLLPEKRAYLYPAGHSNIFNLLLQSPKALAAIWNALVNIPPTIVNFHNENIVDFILQQCLKATDEKKLHITGYVVKAILLLPLLWGIFKVMKSRKRAFYTLIFTWGLFYIFQVEVFWGLLRHDGFYYIFLFMTLCLGNITADNTLIKILLGIQLLASGWAIGMELQYDYSGAERAIHSIASGEKHNIVVETNNAPYASALKGYAGHNPIKIYINGHYNDTEYVKWENIPADIKYDDNRFRNELVILKTISRKTTNASSYLITSYDPMAHYKPLVDSLTENGGKLMKFDETINDENYYVLKIN